MCSGGESDPRTSSQECVTMHARPLLVGQYSSISTIQLDLLNDFIAGCNIKMINLAWMLGGFFL